MSGIQVVSRISPINLWTNESFSQFSRPEQFGQPYKIEISFFTDPRTGIQYKVETSFIFDPLVNDQQCQQIPGLLPVNSPINFSSGINGFFTLNVPKVITKDDISAALDSSDKKNNKKTGKAKEKLDSINQDIEGNEIPKEKKKKKMSPLGSLSTYFRENECLICGFIALYESKENSKEHLKTHLQGESFVCDCCDESFATASLLYKHKIKKTKKKPYVCEICQKKFKRNSFLSAHFRVQHAPFVQPSVPTVAKRNPRPKYFMRPNFECFICQKRFRNMPAVTQHRSYHGGADKFKCVMCQKLFFNSDELMQHRHVRAAGESYTCFTCKKQFSSQHSLTEHKKLHKRKQLFTCVVCNEKFYLQCKLLEHQRLKHTVS